MFSTISRCPLFDFFRNLHLGLPDSDPNGMRAVRDSRMVGGRLFPNSFAMDSAQTAAGFGKLLLLPADWVVLALFPSVPEVPRAVFSSSGSMWSGRCGVSLHQCSIVCPLCICSCNSCSHCLLHNDMTSACILVSPCICTF